MKSDEEYIEQVKFCKYLEILKNQSKIVEYFSIENENKQSFSNRNIAVRIAQKQKRSGKKSGVSDLCIILKDKVLFIEMKKQKKKLKSGKLSSAGIHVADSQVEFLEIVCKSDIIDGSICYGFDEAKTFLDGFLG